MNLSEIPINFEWGHLALKILHDISLNLDLLILEKNLVETSKEIAVDKKNAVMVDITGMVDMVGTNHDEWVNFAPICF